MTTSLRHLPILQIIAIMLVVPALIHAENQMVITPETPDRSLTISPLPQPEPPQHLAPFPGIPEKSHALYTCNDCTPEHRQWYSDLRELKRAATLCGYDFLEIKITQPFLKEDQRSTLTVYARSHTDGSLMIDSAVTVYHSPVSAKELRVTYPHRSHALTLPSRFHYGSLMSASNTIDAAAAHCATFSAGCTVRSSEPSWFFILDTMAYQIEDGNLRSVAVPSDIVIAKSVHASAEYRIGLWGTSPHRPGRQRMTRGVPPDILMFSVNDSTTLCRVAIECTSSYGLSRYVLSSTSAQDTIPLQGTRQHRHTVTFNASPEDTLLSLEVTDTEGNRTLRTVPLFSKRRAEDAQRAERETIAQITKEQAQNNPLTHGMYYLSRFTGNPLSYISGKILAYKTHKKIDATRDFPVEKRMALTFPCEGIVHPKRLEHTDGHYNAAFSVNTIAMRGAFIDSLVNPTLISPGHTPCRFSLTAPLMNGKHPYSWSIDTAGEYDITDNKVQSVLLVCSEARLRNESVHLHDLPGILPAPSRNVRFALCHIIPDTSSDTLTYTCCVRYTDRSSDLLNYRMTVVNGTVTQGSLYTNSSLIVEDVVMKRQEGSICFLIPMSLHCRKDIFRVDTFVHSLRENKTTGWGTVACQG